MYNDPVGNLATLQAERKFLVKKNGNHKKGMAICKKMGCTRIVEECCYGWDDPLFMWDKYGECPHFSDDRNLIGEIHFAIQEYEKKH